MPRWTKRPKLARKPRPAVVTGHTAPEAPAPDPGPISGDTIHPAPEGGEPGTLNAEPDIGGGAASDEGKPTFETEAAAQSFSGD